MAKAIQIPEAMQSMNVKKKVLTCQYSKNKSCIPMITLMTLHTKPAGKVGSNDVRYILNSEKINKHKIPPIKIDYLATNNNQAYRL